jgi:lipid II:glycine glycyltransferase (peptidoglycan interpeptide bridge formation enzyme)
MQRQKIECKIPGITVIEKTTHIVDLHKSENELWLEMEGRCRTAIRKAQKSGVTVSLETDPEIIDIYYKLLTGLYANQKMCVPHDKNFYREIFESFSGNSLFILASRIESQIIGGIILVRDRERFYYLDGASNPDFNHLNPNNLLLWEGILLAKRLGGLKFDFVGSDIPRLAAFKKSFGGDLHYHSCLEKAYVPGFALLRKLYPAIKAIAGRFSKRDDV